MIAALYARYSSDNQREESITAQLRTGREYCKRKGYSIIKEYADEAMTGTNDNRPGWQQMMRDAEHGMFETLICHKIDRMGRDEYEYYTNKFRLNGWGVHVDFSAQPIDSSTPEGALMENQLAGFAAYYSRNLSKEVKKGLKENVLAGLLTGGKPAFGYGVDTQKRYVINDYEAVGIKYIFESYLNGSGYIAICNWLNSHGYRTRRSNTFGKNSIHDILTNRRYIGTCILGKNTKSLNGKRNNHRPDPKDLIVVEDACPAIIDKELFRKVAEKMQANKHAPGAYRAKHNYLLSGLIVCGECDSAMTGSVSSKRNGEPIRYYRCSRKNNKGTHVCKNRNVSADDLEGLVLAEMGKIYLDPKAIDSLMDRVTKIYNDRANNQTTQLAELQKKENAARRRLNNIYTSIEDGEADEFDLERLKQTKKELLSLRADHTELENSSIPPLSKEQIVKYIDKYRDDLHSNDAARLRALINAFIEKIIVTTDTIRIRYRLEFVGAPGENRTHAFSSGGQRSIHWATGAHHRNRIYYNIPIDSCPIKSNFRQRKFFNCIISVYFSGVFV